MRRTGKQSLIVIAIVLALPATARGYHAGSTFDSAPGAGGGGGLFYTGSPRERGWDCTACHLDPPRKLRVDIESNPAELLASSTYRADTMYVITIRMRDPSSQLGLESTRSNFNSMAVTFSDRSGAPAGTIGGFDPGRFFARGRSILASSSTVVNETEWTFSWTAPPAGFGPVGMYLGIVDGNGADARGLSTLTDPLGDDVAAGAFELVEASASGTGGAARAAAKASVGATRQASFASSQAQLPAPPIVLLGLAFVALAGLCLGFVRRRLG